MALCLMCAGGESVNPVIQPIQSSRCPQSSRNFALGCHSATMATMSVTACPYRGATQKPSPHNPRSIDTAPENAASIGAYITQSHGWPLCLTGSDHTPRLLCVGYRQSNVEYPTEEPSCCIKPSPRMPLRINRPHINKTRNRSERRRTRRSDAATVRDTHLQIESTRRRNFPFSTNRHVHACGVSVPVSAALTLMNVAFNLHTPLKH